MSELVEQQPRDRNNSVTPSIAVQPYCLDFLVINPLIRCKIFFSASIRFSVLIYELHRYFQHKLFSI